MLSPDSEESRKQFEAWAKDSWGEDATEKVGKDFCYSKSWINSAWQGWQAARQPSQSEPVYLYSFNGGGSWFSSDKTLYDVTKDDSTYDWKVLYAAPQQAIPSGWISVKDRLPEDGAYVQAHSPNYGQCTACFTTTTHGVQWWCRGQDTAINPSHWMPLPASPTAPIERDK
jgi:hypothetical protein